MSEQEFTEVDFRHHPLAVNARLCDKFRNYVAWSFVICVIGFAAALVVRSQNQRALIMLPNGQIACGELRDLDLKSPLMSALATHYADQVLSWDWRYENGLARTSHLAEIADSSGLPLIATIRERLKAELSLSHSNQKVEVSPDGILIKKKGKLLEAVVMGRLHTGARISSREHIDAFRLSMTMAPTYSDELSESEPGFFESLFSKSKQNGLDFAYPFVITNLQLEKENLQ